MRRSTATITTVLAYVVVASVLIWPAAALAEPWALEAKITASDASLHTRPQFGRAMAVSGTSAAIAAWYDDEAGTYAGAMYVYDYSAATGWEETAKLTAAETDEGDSFGSAVAMDGPRIVVGASSRGGYYPEGAAYVFDRGPSGWFEAATLTPSDPQANDQFGYSVSVSGDRAIVGTSLAGAAYVFERDVSGAWNEVAKLTASDLSGNQGLFGQSVSLSGDYAIVGAYGANGTPSGAAYVFERDVSGSWAQAAKLVASDAEEGEAFGWSVAIQGDRALIGAIRDNENGNNSGAAYVFDRDETGLWSEAAKMMASDGSARDTFGVSVALDGDVALIGAHNGWSTPDGPTAAYAFECAAGTWTETAIMRGRSDLRDYFGEDVAVSQGFAFIGAYADDDSGQLAGAVYVYNVPEPATLSLLALGGLATLRRKTK